MYSWQPGLCFFFSLQCNCSLISRLMGPKWDPSGADRTQVGPILAPWTLLSGLLPCIIAVIPAHFPSCSSYPMYIRPILLYSHKPNTIWFVEILSGLLNRTYGSKQDRSVRGQAHQILRVILHHHEVHGLSTHDDVINWKHFPRYWLFVRGIHRSPVIVQVMAWRRPGDNSYSEPMMT